MSAARAQITPAQAAASQLARIELIRRGLPLRALDPVIKKGRRLAEAEDPMAAMAEILGYPTTPDIERCAGEILKGGKVLAVGCHDGGKTFWEGALLFIWEWFCKGCLPDPEDGDPQGGILALVAPTGDGVLTTSWKAINVHAARAWARGWKIPGYDPAGDAASVIFRAKPHRWFMTSRTFRKPAGAVRKPIIAAGSGLKHDNLIVWGEEVDEIDKRYHRTIEGWGPRIVFFAFNPYSASGPAFDLAQGGEWRVAEFSYLRVPQVLRRRIDTPGLADHLKLESEIRYQCQALGGYPEVQPDEKRHDFVYGLPESDTEDVEGPRPDGFPGSPAARLQVFRPSIEVDAGRLGQFPVVSEHAVFSEVAWGAALERDPEPGWPPDAVGVDTAEGGPDRFVMVPRWGPSAADVWRIYQAAISTGGVVEMVRRGDKFISQAEALRLALRCPLCVGDGCDRCDNGMRRIIYGEPLEIQKTDDAAQMAARILAKWATGPKYKLDASAGGYWIAPAMKTRGADAEIIAFGSGPGDDLPGQRLYLNQRAAMAGKIATTMTLDGAVSLPRSQELRRQARILEWIPEKRADGESAGGKLTRYRLEDKPKLKLMLGGVSPDHLDGFFLTEGAPIARNAAGSNYVSY